MIGFLSGGTPVGYTPYATALRQGLKESGYIEGQNVAIEYRWAEGQNAASQGGTRRVASRHSRPHRLLGRYMR
jgi:hypothetical protein